VVGMGKVKGRERSKVSAREMLGFELWFGIG
jgi:hypothetical protein